MFLAHVIHMRSAADVIYRRRPHLKIYCVPAELSLNDWAFNSEQRLALTNKELAHVAKVQFNVHVAFARGPDATSAACYVGGLPTGCSSVRWLTIRRCHVQRCSGSLTNGAGKGAYLPDTIFLGFGELYCMSYDICEISLTEEKES
jgi:hypothetical protein